MILDELSLMKIRKEKIRLKDELQKLAALQQEMKNIEELENKLMWYQDVKSKCEGGFLASDQDRRYYSCFSRFPWLLCCLTLDRVHRQFLGYDAVSLDAYGPEAMLQLKNSGKIKEVETYLQQFKRDEKLREVKV